MKDINAYLQTFKEKKEKQRIAAQKKKKEATRQKLKEIYKSQKEAIQREKKELTDKLISQRQKPQQKPPKWLTEPLKNNVGDSLFNEDNLYSFEELVNIETLYPNEEGRLDWLKFNQIVERGREEIAEILNSNYHI